MRYYHPISKAGDGAVRRAVRRGAARPDSRAEAMVHDPEPRVGRRLVSADGVQRKGRIAGPALLAGVLLALSLPPWGWWPLAPAGFAILYRRLDGLPLRARAWAGWVCGLGLYGIGLFWMGEFNILGVVLAVVGSALFLLVAAVLTPAGPGAALAFPAAMVLTEAVRFIWPFHGMPLGGVPMGQADGAFAPAARVGGALLLMGLAALAGVALAEASRRRWRVAAVALAVVVVVVVAGNMASRGRQVATIDVAIVQGGGPRGLRASQDSAERVLDAHLSASSKVRTGLDLVLWPEDVVDVEDSIDRTPEGAELEQEARRLGAKVFVAGVVEGEGTGRFRITEVAYDREGRQVDRYDKTRLVPFGEYVPFRSLVRRVADLSDVPYDAIRSEGRGVLRTPLGRLGVMISYEVFFPELARGVTRGGARLLLVPTNAASFSTTQVPTQELAASQLRALETGRDVLQAAPTGYGAVIDHDGRVRARTVLGKRQVLHAQVGLRQGSTPYVRWGNLPLLVLAVAALVRARLTVRSTSRLA